MHNYLLISIALLFFSLVIISIVFVGMDCLEIIKKKKIVTQAITQFFATTVLQQIMSCEKKVVSLCVSDRQVIHNLQHQSCGKNLCSSL